MAQDAEEQKLNKLLEEMQEDGLPAQQGGFHIEAIPTGIPSFDHSTGVGGFPRRRICVVQGEEASGKTLLLLTLIANVQNEGGRAAFVDLEHALTPGFAELLGVDYDDLTISRPRTLNEAYDVSKRFATSGLFDVVGFDSAVALPTVAEVQTDARESDSRAGKAQLHSQELPKVVSVLNDKTVFVIINQQREDPNPPAWWSAGKKLYSPGGRALRHNASLIVDVRKRKTYKNGKTKIGHKTETYIRKNKVAQPFQRAEFDLMYASGIDLISDLISTALRHEVIRQSSSHFYLDIIDDEGVVLQEYHWNGRKNMENFIKSDTDESTRIRNYLQLKVSEFEDHIDPPANESAMTGWETVSD